jgi:hypothetical protein
MVSIFLELFQIGQPSEVAAQRSALSLDSRLKISGMTGGGG